MTSVGATRRSERKYKSIQLTKNFSRNLLIHPFRSMTITRAEQASVCESAFTANADGKYVVVNVPPKRDLSVRIYPNLREANALSEFRNKCHRILAGTLLHWRCTFTIPVLSGRLQAGFLKFSNPARLCRASSFTVFENC